MRQEIADQEITNIPQLRSGKAIRGYDLTHRVFLWQIETVKVYKCWTCDEEISNAAPHTFVRYLFPDKRGYDHHHIHNQCARDRWLAPPPDGRLSDCEVIPLRKVPLKRRRRGKHE